MLVSFLAYGFVVALIAVPVAAQHAVAGVRFDDRLGTLPVEVSLSHNGVSTLDTGILGRIYLDRTGIDGFGANMRATGPPEAGGTLASYVSPQFVRANAQFVTDSGVAARVYGDELSSQLWHGFWWVELWAGVVGGIVLALVFRGRAPSIPGLRSRRRRIAAVVLVPVVALGLSTLVALHLFRQWEGNDEIGVAYPMPGNEELSFSSPQALEVARQVQPFIVKNTDRIRAATTTYETAADRSLRLQLPAHAAALAPRDGERIVIAEADPQGSEVGTAVRTALYPLLEDQLGADAFAMRTISGDISSNGTVAESGFIEDEAGASPGIPTVAVKGDHDTDTTVDQLLDNDVIVPDLETVDVGGLRVAVANDPAFKALFGGLVINDTGVTEDDIGKQLRAKVDPTDPLFVLFHQPRSVDGYLGIDSTGELASTIGRETVPWDDGIPDVPPGTINYGHLHDQAGPWVVWNTDGDLVTWTVVNQLGTSGGVEENPTFNRFSTPISVPLKAVSLQLQYVNEKSGLQTGYASIQIDTDGIATITDRIDLGLPGGQPLPRDEAGL